MDRGIRAVQSSWPHHLGPQWLSLHHIWKPLQYNSTDDGMVKVVVYVKMC